MAVTEKKKFIWPPVSLRLLLTVLFMVIGLIPVIIGQVILTGSLKQSQVSNKRIEVQNQCLILSDKMTRSSFIKNMNQDTLINSEIETIADVYNGRIVIVDKSYRIVKDTFSIAVGKYSIAQEVLNCFKGETSNSYDKEKNYILQTIPIYDSTPEKGIDGVILITASTENIVGITDSVKERGVVLNVIIALILLVISFVLSGLIVKPFKNLKKSISKIADGDLNQNVNQNTYYVTRDVSSMLNATLDKLKSVDQSRGEFVANVSHELKTPITSIRVLADSLMSMEDAPVDLYKEFMTDISVEIDRESKIIDDLLTLVKLDKSAIELNTEPVDIGAMMEQILRRLRPIAKERNIELTLEIIREVTAEVDETKISLALSNLVENAIKYNHDDGWVKVSVDADHQFSYVKVQDSGVGIPEEFQESVFDRFYRVDKARSRETGGTGLGLAITRNIIQLHHGIIKLSSKEGEGSTFSVRIPLTYIKEGR